MHGVEAVGELGVSSPPARRGGSAATAALSGESFTTTERRPGPRAGRSPIRFDNSPSWLMTSKNPITIQIRVHTRWALVKEACVNPCT